jgi:hypothetical protein
MSRLRIAIDLLLTAGSEIGGAGVDDVDAALGVSTAFGMGTATGTEEIECGGE